MELDVKVKKVKDGGNLLGLATVNFGNTIEVNSITVKQGKDGEPFVAMPSYRSNQLDEEGNIVFKDVCNPISKEFREELYGAIMKAYETGEQVKTGNQEKPKLSARVTAYETGKNTKGFATLYLNKDFVVSNISLKKGREGSMYMAMPSFRTNNIDEHGRDIYRDICTPVDKEAAREIRKLVFDGYKEQVNGAKEEPRYDFDQLEKEALEGNPFIEGKEVDKGMVKEEKPAAAKAPSHDKEHKPSIKERLAKGEAKKNAALAKAEDKVLTGKPREAMAI